MFKTCVGCDVTQALKKDVHASVDEHIRRPATAPHVPMSVWLCVHACMNACVPVGWREKVMWTESRFVAAGPTT